MVKKVYTLNQAVIDYDAQHAKTIYKKLKPEEYSEFRKQAIKEIEEVKQR